MDKHRVSRINFNGGDAFDWRRRGATYYRGTAEDWPDWLSNFVALNKVTDIILFGDCRPLHVAAIQLAARKSIPVHVFEEGYLRPNFVTLEQGGVNGNSSLPISLSEFLKLEPSLTAHPQAIPIKSRFGRRCREAMRYVGASLVCKPFFPHFRSHRELGVGREIAGWVSRWLRKTRELRQSRQALEQISGAPFMLLPLQLNGDAQVSHHSDFSSMQTALSAVIASFSRAAPQELNLLVKRHPFDPDLDNWRRTVEQVASEFRVANRVFYIERGDLDPLLSLAVGVVTVNSTVGPLALQKGVPVKALGEAIYNIDGLTASVDLDCFWREPGTVDGANFELFCRVLVDTCLVNGGFHDQAALELLTENSVARLLSDIPPSPSLK